jgi:hypothetical protein
MTINDVASQLQLLIKAVAPPLIEVSDTPLESPQWISGQRVQAQVMASLPNGRFQVLISDQQMDMNLPRNTQPGDKIDLTFVSAQPRPTFVLTRDVPLPQGAQSNAKLSEAARFLGALLNNDVSVSKGPAAALTRATPILSGPPSNVPDLARQLGKMLTQSGLFYESHQAQWVAGQRPLGELLQEPQGQLSPRLLMPQLAAGQVLQQHVLPQVAPAPAAQSSLPELSAPTSTAQIGTVAAKPMGEPVHPQATGLVQQQLEVLDGRQVVWQGQVWPGQNMEWRVEEREPQHTAGEQENGADWQTSLRLHMPRLGSVEAALSLTSRGIQLKLNAEESRVVNLMQQRQGELQQSMEAAGLQVLSFAVDLADEKT